MTSTCRPVWRPMPETLRGRVRVVCARIQPRPSGLRDRVLRSDPIAVDIHEHREPHYVNDLRQAGKLAGMMESSSSTRLLAAPLYLDRRIIGILDARDKAGREPFTPEDLSWVSDILRRLAQRVRTIPRFAAAVVSRGQGE